GGAEKWKQFLLRNLNYNLPAEKGAAAGDYTVIVQFIVNKEGNVQNARALTSHGYGMEREAVRVISKGPNWIPAIQNGKNVAAYRKQPITFSVKKGNDGKMKSEITTKYDQNVSINNVENSLKKEIASRQLPEIVVTGFGNEYNNETKQSYVNMPILAPVEAGSIEWRRFFERNLNPNLAIKEYWQPGTYKLYMQFSTDQDGVISDAEILNYSNSETAKYCLDLIRHIPKLIPETGSGKRSKIIYFQPLVFIQEDKNESIPKITKEDFQKSSVNKLLELNQETEILSYSFTIYFPNGFTETKNTGSLISNASKILVNRAEPGTIFSLNYPRIIKDGKEMSASSKIYRLTD
ncbi:MAG: TonB family protein, partial [Bacteroidia bacterium]|nr:TonB family protein [Bacteroidia bacterium]